MSAIRTRFRGRRPLSNLKALALMFLTLILQYLNKLSESKVGDFTSPQVFHTVKVQRLYGNRIKPFAQVGSNLVVPVLALVGYMPIQSRKLSDTTPIVVRTFDFTRKAFAQCSEFFQGVFQKLWRLFLFAGAECEICLHPEVYPYALTCSRIGFGGRDVCNHVKPIGSNTIAKDLDIANFTVPVAVVVEREPTFVELQGLSGFVPRFQREANTPFFKQIRRLELRRTVSSFALELWKSAKSVKEPFISDMDTDNHFVKCITGYPSPVSMRAFEQLRQVRLQAETPRIFTIASIVSFLKFEKVVMDIGKVIKHIPETHMLGVFAQLELVCSAILFRFSFPHGVSRITLLSPIQWEETSTLPSGNAESAGLQRDTYIKPQFTENVKW